MSRIPRKLKKRLKAESQRFTCAVCRGTFRKAWSEEEAMAESATVWGHLPKEALVAICDDCYQARP